MSGIPGQRAGQRPTRAAVAVQRILGRAANNAGVYAGEIGLTSLSGERVTLGLDEAGREVWTDETGARAWVLDPGDYDDEDEG